MKTFDGPDSVKKPPRTPHLLRTLERALRRGARRALAQAQGRRFVHVLHIGKTGGTAVKHALKGARAPGHAIYLREHRETLRDVPAGEGVVFFLRDPVSRFVSAFYSRQRAEWPRYVSSWTPGERRAFERFKTVNELACALLSRDAEERAAAEDAMREVGQAGQPYSLWLGSEAELRSRAKDIFFIGFQESLAADFEALKLKLNLGPAVSLPTDDVQANRNPAGIDKRLDAAALENLQRWYAGDYRLVEVAREIAAEIARRPRQF